ncbi:6,7-dimethyl-8-ribityllumazine synthase [Persicirhabdus sediminis]|uniref:6,7-dimethyl-8-ribityllumazine synthase n=1 Tax=Persicirhabdus sediminis TaxID=454144 RepID=A0A8J7MGE5_9BACT|nr:6,7-dimethyl-8-ribityllumazine synthase [Persicirhabdus sediminis]MBK1792308.1 6,7-dimethyl-8-ribityllumazine synthase [Persicirhabdus sediminis]
MKLAIISASWQAELLDAARDCCLTELSAQGINTDQQVDYFKVPGCLELPLMAKKLAETGRYDGVIAFGLMIDAGVYRHEFVTQAVIDGFMRIQLDTGVPVFSAVLTPHHFHQHQDHIDFFAQHLKVKGKEVASSALSFINTLRSI